MDIIYFCLKLVDQIRQHLEKNNRCFILLISKTSKDLHKKLKEIADISIYGRPQDGSVYGTFDMYGGIYGGQLGSQYGNQYLYESTGPYDPYSLGGETPYGEMYPSQRWGNYGVKTPYTNTKYGKQGTVNINRGSAGQIGSPKKGGVSSNKNKNKKNKMRVLTYFKLKFKTCGAHLKPLVKKVGYGNIARVSEVVPHHNTGKFKQIQSR